MNKKKRVKQERGTKRERERERARKVNHLSPEVKNSKNYGSSLANLANWCLVSIRNEQAQFAPCNMALEQVLIHFNCVWKQVYFKHRYMLLDYYICRAAESVRASKSDVSNFC